MKKKKRRIEINAKGRGGELILLPFHYCSRYLTVVEGLPS